MTAARGWSLRLRDFSAAFAFAAMAVSGEVPLPICALFAVAFVAGISGWRPLRNAGRLAVVPLILAALGLYAAVGQGAMDLVVAACSFAALLSAHRILSAPSFETDDQVLLVSLLMVAGAASLSGELLFAVCLAGFTVTASISRGLGLLARIGDGEDIPLHPILPKLFRGSMVALLGGAIVFVAFPRLSWNVASRAASRGLGKAETGFSNGVRLGSGGDIKTNPRPVFRVRLRPDPKTDVLDTYWVGKALDVFDGRDWSSAFETNQNPPSVKPRWVLAEDAPGDRIDQKIELLPAFGLAVVPVMERPVSVGPAMTVRRGVDVRLGIQYFEDTQLKLAREPTGALITATSIVGDGPAAALPSGDLARFTALPQTIDPRILALARQVVGNERDPLGAAQRLQQHLLSNYTYTLELDEVPEDQDPLAYFLFEKKSGHCEYFATALAVMLRAGGFGSRIATGFFGGERSQDGFVVRAGDAHAWTQVLVPGAGFFTIDATPPSHRGGRPAWLLAALVRLYERVDNLWRQSVLEFSILDQARMAQSIVTPGPRARTRMNIPWTRTFASAAVFLFVYGLWRRFGGSRSARHEATALLDVLEHALALVPEVESSSDPVEKKVRDLAERNHPMASIAQVVLQRYLEARFGSSPLKPGERRALRRSLNNSRAGQTLPLT